MSKLNLDHVLKGVPHRRFKNRKISELSLDELSILKTRWVDGFIEPVRDCVARGYSADLHYREKLAEMELVAEVWSARMGLGDYQI